ncbi:MAG: ATP-binding protein [Saprospirales bacterium]|nr:ATP-binding protein [Saprospirales bacterium]
MNNSKQYPFKIVLTGPESSGKTTLAKYLAHSRKVVWVQEFARCYLAGLGRPYKRTDLQYIGRGQYAWEQWVVAQKPPQLICDTDWTVLHVWEHYRFGLPDGEGWEWEKGYLKRQPANLYLLCAPDFPWQPDPLREHPAERQIIFKWYERLLQETAAPYAVLQGSFEQRIKTAISLIRRNC